MPKKAIVIFLILFISIILMGCANTKNFKQADKEQIHTLSIQTKFVKFNPSKDIVFLNTDARGWTAGLLGPIGAVAYEAMHDDSPEAAIIWILSTDNLLKNTVSESFFYQFENSGLFEVVSTDSADAYLEIEVKDIQLHEMNGDKLRYTGLYFARIYNSGGNLLWAKHDFFSAFNKDLVEFTLEQYLSDPSRLRHAVSVLSQMLAIEFIKELNGNHGAVSYNLHPIRDNAFKDENKNSHSEKFSGQDSKTIEEKLTRLKKIYTDELITKEEYDIKRKEIIESY